MLSIIARGPRFLLRSLAEPGPEGTEWLPRGSEPGVCDGILEGGRGPLPVCDGLSGVWRGGPMGCRGPADAGCCEGAGREFIWLKRLGLTGIEFADTGPAELGPEELCIGGPPWPGPEPGAPVPLTRRIRSG